MTQPARPINSFEEVGELLDAQASAVGEVIHGYGPPWAAGSPAEAECQLDEAMHGTPYLTTALLVGQYLIHAADHLLGAARLAGDPEVVMGSVTITRPVLGSTSRAMWLFDPSIGPTERLRRGLNLRLTGLVELENIASDRDPTLKHDVAASHAPVINEIERNAQAAGLPRLTRTKVRKDGSRRPHYFGTEVPGDMQLLRALLDIDGSDPTADVVFRVASAFIHGEHHTLNLMSRQVTDTPRTPGVAGVSLGFRLDNFVTFMASPVIGVHRVALAALRYAGLPDEVWQDLMQPLMHRWQATMHAVRDTAFRNLAPTRAG